MNSDGIMEITQVEFDKLMAAYPIYPRGLYLLQKDGKWIAVDNSEGQAFTEEFGSREEAVCWLNGEFEVTEGGMPDNG